MKAIKQAAKLQNKFIYNHRDNLENLQELLADTKFLVDACDLTDAEDIVISGDSDSSTDVNGDFESYIK